MLQKLKADKEEPKYHNELTEEVYCANNTKWKRK